MNKTELQKHRARVAARKYRYGITEEEYDALLEAQGNACAVCRTEFTDKVRANVDHNHLCCPGPKSCGKCLRGLLCSECLTLSSIMEQRFQYMNNMFHYLTKYLMSEVNT